MGAEKLFVFIPLPPFLCQFGFRERLLDRTAKVVAAWLAEGLCRYSGTRPSAGQGCLPWWFHAGRERAKQELTGSWRKTLCGG